MFHEIGKVRMLKLKTYSCTTTSYSSASSTCAAVPDPPLRTTLPTSTTPIQLRDLMLLGKEAAREFTQAVPKARVLEWLCHKTSYNAAQCDKILHHLCTMGGCTQEGDMITFPDHVRQSIG